MTASETGLDPDKFIFGEGVYSNLQTARPSADDREFRIEPAPIPFRTIVAYNALFVLVFGGLTALTTSFSNESIFWRCYVPIGLGIATCVLFTAIVWYRFSAELRRGPWLIFDKRTQQVRLPRVGCEFNREEVVHLQFITTKRLQFKRIAENDQLSELNIVTRRDGSQQRWPLLRSVFGHQAFDDVLRSVATETDLPIVRVTDEMFGWNVTEAPYEPKK